MTQRILHTVNQSPFASQLLSQCIERCSSNDSVVLLEDGVYGALKTQPYAERLQPLQHCYAIAHDVEARGLTQGQLLENVTLISYDKFVSLCVEHPLSHSWY